VSAPGGSSTKTTFGWFLFYPAKLGFVYFFWYYFYMSYFDKTFFKFTLGFLCIVCISLVIMYFVSNFATDNENQATQSISVP
jgi:hypothetical protein